jgi:hypothetical protein
MNDLREITKEPYFLEKAGFARREEETSDVVRWVWYEKTIESQVTFVLQVEFEMSISDNPFVKTGDNFTYSFNGVFLGVIEEETESEEPLVDLPNGPPIALMMEKERREIDRLELSVNTLAELRSLCKMLGCKDEGPSMTIEAALAHSAEVSHWLDSSIHGLDIPSNDREAMAAALFDQVHEHHKAIQLLLKNSLTGSAFSLVRPTFETFVRGVWLLRCASEEEVSNFAKDKIVKKSFGDLIKEIEARPGYDVGVLSKVKKSAWGPMSSYAHGGFFQAVRRITPDHITADYSDDEILEVINSSRTFALLAASEIFLMTKRNDLVEEVLERMRSASSIQE